MIKVNVFPNSDESKDWQPWWVNFRNHYLRLGYDMDDDKDIGRALLDWGAIDIPESPEFYFETENAQAFFMLRFA